MISLLIRKTAEKAILGFPVKIKNLYYLALRDLREYGIHPEGWEIKKMSGYDSRYRLKITQHYRLIYEWEADTKTITVIDASTREGSYK